MNIRNSAKAIIIQDGYLLAIKKQQNNHTYYVVPGGGQEHGENLHEAVIRECKEELGAEVEVGELLFVREYMEKTINSRINMHLPIKRNLCFYVS